MKDRSSTLRMALAGMTATAVCLIVLGSVARAQGTSTNDTASRPPATSAAQGPPLPYGVGEVVKMYQGGINKDIILNFINSTSLPYRLTADGIIYLQSLGLPPEITKAMLLREGQMQQQQQANQQYYPQQPMPGAMPPPYGDMTAQPPVQVMTPSTPAPDVSVAGADYGDDVDYGNYSYGYPYYGYGYGWPYYYPTVVVGGWGRGFGFRGFRGAVGGFRGGVGFRGGGSFGGFRGGGGIGGFRAGGSVGGFRGGGGGGHAGGGGGHGGVHR